MGEFLKCIDPAVRWIWQHPAMPDVRFEYRALAGPTLTRDIGARYLNDCITRAWNVDVPGIGAVAEWNVDAGPRVEWSRVLPADVANAVFLEIARVSALTDDERRDSRLPRGPQSGTNNTNATDAVERVGSVRDGNTPSTTASRASAPKRRRPPTGKR